MPEQDATPAATTIDTKFKVIETICDPDGIIIEVTEREHDGRVSFAIFREYEVGGKSKRTSYMKRVHIPAIRRLLNDIEDRLELAEDRTRAKRRG
jgi:hypothetical protein